MTDATPPGIDWEQLALWNLSVFPLQPKGKKPVKAWRAPSAEFPDGNVSDKWEEFQHRRPVGAELVRWSKQVGLNAAVACGRISGIIVLDTDSAEVDEEVRRRGVPLTPVVKTAKGRHYYFEWPGFEVRNTAGFRKQFVGCDLRGDGGYVVAAGSVHPTGHVYAWEVTPDQVQFAEAPAWLIDLIKAKTKGRQKGDDLPAGGGALPPGTSYAEAALDRELAELRRAPVGTHNDTLNIAAFKLGQLIGAGVIERRTVESHLLATAMAIGQPRKRAEDTIKRGIDDGMLQPRDLPKGAARAPRLRVVSASKPPPDDDAPALTDDRGGGRAIDPDETFPDEIGPLPIIPLGQLDGTYYVIARSHELRSLGTRDLTANGLLGLFDGDMSWLRECCPETPRGKGIVTDFNVRSAAAWLMRLCAKRGLYDPNMPIRGPGVWPLAASKVGADPLLLIHCGAEIYLDGYWRPAGHSMGDAIYPAFPKLDKPLFAPSKQLVARDRLMTGAALGHGLRQRLDLWSFKNDFVAGLLVGFIGQSLLGAAPRWRVHVLLTGPRGSGKSALLKFIGAALGAMGRKFNRYSEPGLRQILNRYARAVLLDEAEGSSLRILPVIELLRNMAGDDGVESVLGTNDQTGTTQTVTGSVAMSAINAPQLQPQDRSRIFGAEMTSPGGKSTTDEVEAAIAWAEQHSALLWARAIEGWPRYLQAFGTFRAKLRDAGCDMRQADMFASLLAGRDMLLNDEPIDADSAEPLVARLKPLIAIIKLDDELDSDPAQCLARLLSSQVEHWSKGRKSTVGRLIQEGLFRDDTGVQARETLKNYGLRLEIGEFDGDKAPKPFLLVAHRHDALTKIYAGTPWEGGGWRGALGRLDGAYERQNPVWFTGIKVRATEVPEACLPMMYDPEVGLDMPP